MERWASAESGDFSPWFNADANSTQTHLLRLKHFLLGSRATAL